MIDSLHSARLMYIQDDNLVVHQGNQRCKSMKVDYRLTRIVNWGHKAMGSMD